MEGLDFKVGDEVLVATSISRQPRYGIVTKIIHKLSDNRKHTYSDVEVFFDLRKLVEDEEIGFAYTDTFDPEDLIRV